MRTSLINGLKVLRNSTIYFRRRLSSCWGLGACRQIRSSNVTETSPDQGRKGSFGSPDVIPVGTTPVSPEQFTTDVSYGQYYNNSFYQNTPNYIYVRAKNSSMSLPKSGKANLVLTNPAIVLWAFT